jgi:pSer/pThr/pTyr-binding forkhead associated (FHA) protein
VARLLRDADGLVGEDVEVTEDVFRIGRGTENDLVIDESSISRTHARLEREAGAYRVIDLASTNGTTVDGIELRPWQPQPLVHGSNILLAGEVELRFLLSETERAGGDAATTRRIAERTVRLTTVESEVLELLFLHYDEGRAAPRVATLKEIAERRFTGVPAVKMTLQGLYDKFELEGQAERNKETLALRAQQWKVTRTRF